MTINVDASKEAPEVVEPDVAMPPIDDGPSGEPTPPGEGEWLEPEIPEKPGKGKGKGPVKPKPKKSSTKVLNTGKNGSYEVLKVDEEDKKTTVVIENVLQRPAAGYKEFAPGERLVVNSELVK